MGKSRRNMAAAGAAVIFMAVLAVVIIMTGRLPDEAVYAVSGKVDMDGTIHFIQESGEVVSIPGEAVKGYTTSAFERFVILDETGMIYETDAAGGKKHVICEQASDLDRITEAGVVYRAVTGETAQEDYDEIMDAIVADYEGDITRAMLEEVLEESGLSESASAAKYAYKTLVEKEYESPLLEEICRYSFEEEEHMVIGTGAYKTAADNNNMLYTDNGEVFYIAEDSTEREWLGRYEGDVYLEGIWEDGRYGVWLVTDEAQVTVCISEEGVVEQVDTYELADDFTTDFMHSLSYRLAYWTFYSEQDQTVVMANEESHRLYIKSSGQKADIISFGENSGAIYIRGTDHRNSGRYLNYPAYFSAQEFYVEVQTADNTYDLYFIDEDRNCEQVLSDVREVIALHSGLIHYIDEHAGLYRGKLDKAEITEAEKLASGVETADVSRDGQFLYYLKEYEETEMKGTLCYAAYGKEEEQVSDHVYRYNMRIGSDGQSAAYLTDCRYVYTEDSVKGNLNLFRAGKGGTQIAEDVMAVNSLNNEKGMDSKGFIYAQYAEEKAENIYMDYFYYNGRESWKIIDMVVK